MLITVELLLADNPRRSLLTIGELDISLLPGLEAVIECYTERFATIPPGMWYRQYQGQCWLTRSLPGPAFFLFFSRWRNIPEVRHFLESHGQFVHASHKSVREARCDVWINQPADEERVKSASA
ncbi:hypothetical protein EWN99_23020 [Salmonella enterica]|nr:hypothetical protein [Salmonella enterica]EBS3177416.1 hypothetical protein [Salmonella enterica subsp. enterica serovar Newport]EBS3869250.1 hypothetical protein [Salmonella enterica subsp. enterica serovar Kimberley]EDG9410619.1 hypothetical protein [Salmonella enterica subsp. enterica serovar Tennessee]EGM7165276.1 hypothetical protein [Salmonella enterica subsp. enterica serovar Pomona]